MLNEAWILITFVLLLAAVLSHQVPLLLVAILFFLASGTARLWENFALRRLAYERRLSHSSAFFGEVITLELSISNRKLLPLPWVHVQDEVPDQLKLLTGKTARSHKATRAIVSNLVSLSWYYRLTRRYQIRCTKRGIFSFGPATIRSGDIFGFFTKQMEDEKTDQLLIYPRIVPLEHLGIPSRNPFGDLRVQRHLFEDPVRMLSTREYLAGDPLKKIGWKATARLGRLQTRVFEHTTTVGLALFLDVRTVERPRQGQVENLLETDIMVAASVADYCIREGLSFGLYVNEPYWRTDSLVRLPLTSNTEQMHKVLEALAQLQGWDRANVEQVISKEMTSLPWGATVVVVTAVPTDSLLGTLYRVRRAGRSVALILVGDQRAPIDIAGIPVFNVSDQAYWREVEAIAMSRKA